MARTPKTELTAFDPVSGRTYPSWDALVAAQCSGYVIIITSDRPGTRELVYGPWPPTKQGKAAATKARLRLRNKAAQSEKPYKVASSIRLCWKDPS